MHHVAELAEKLLVAGVANDDAIVRIEEHKTFRNGCDRILEHGLRGDGMIASNAI